MQVTSVGRSDDGREDTAEPAPVAVVDNVGRVGNERSVVSVELARLVGGTVVVRVTDRRHAAVGQALDVSIHAECARHFVDHPLCTAFVPLPT